MQGGYTVCPSQQPAAARPGAQGEALELARACCQELPSVPLAPESQGIMMGWLWLHSALLRAGQFAMAGPSDAKSDVGRWGASREELRFDSTAPLQPSPAHHMTAPANPCGSVVCVTAPESPAEALVSQHSSFS